MRAVGSALLLLLVIETVLNGCLVGRFTRTALLRMEEMTSLEAPLIQIFGDSVSDSGINERVIAGALGYSAAEFINFSIPGTTAYCAYPLLKRQIEAGRVPQVVILAYNDRSYTIPLVPKYLGRVGSWSELTEAVRFGVPLETMLSSLACRVSFTLRYREELNAIARTGEGWDYFDPGLNQPTARAARYSALPVEPPSRRPPAVPRQINSEFHRHLFRRSPETTASLGAFFDLAKRHGVHVYLLRMPKTEKAEELHDKNGFNKECVEFLDELVQKHGASWLLRRPATLPPECFVDAVHLDAKAAFDLSLEISRLLRGAPRAPANLSQ